MKKKLTSILALVLVVLLSFFAAPSDEAPEIPRSPSQLQTVTETASAEADTLPPEEIPPAPEYAGEMPDIFGTYTTKEDVALYIHTYGCLPENFMTKAEAKAIGWQGGGLEYFAPGMCIGGDVFGNYEGLLPEDRDYYECDIDTLGAEKRGGKRIVFSEDGLIYYTEDHYASFELLYGEP